MKTLKVLLLLALSAATAAAVLTKTSAKLDDDSAIGSKSDSVEGTIKLPKGKTVPFAAFEIVAKTTSKLAKNPSVTLSIDGVEVAAKTLRNKADAETRLLLVASREIRRKIKADRDEADFKISTKTDGQTKFGIKSVKLWTLTDEKYFRNSSYIRPVFSGDEVVAESVFPMGDADETKPASARLLFAPTEILDAYTVSDGKRVDLENGKDFSIEGDRVLFKQSPKYRLFKYRELHSDNKEDIEKMGATPPFYFDVIKKYAFFKEGNWFHTHQIYISYKHRPVNVSDGEQFDAALLPNTVNFLKGKKPLKITLFGDSISSGANASAVSITIPFMPSWGDIVAQALEKYYKTPITYYNRALGGMDSKWGEENAENLVSPDKPDLVIIAFGMNDRKPADKFRESIQNMISKIRKTNPAAEFILVSSMSANPDWHSFPMHDEYAEVLADMQTKGIAFADVRKVHKFMLQRKRFIDMTGNNVNHPNDFLIRIYAQTVLQKLVPSMSK